MLQFASSGGQIGGLQRETWAEDQRFLLLTNLLEHQLHCMQTQKAIAIIILSSRQQQPHSSYSRNLTAGKVVAQRRVGDGHLVLLVLLVLLEAGQKFHEQTAQEAEQRKKEEEGGRRTN